MFIHSVNEATSSNVGENRTQLLKMLRDEEQKKAETHTVAVSAFVVWDLNIPDLT